MQTKSQKRGQDAAVRDFLNLLDLEDELLILRGTFSALRVIGSSPDSVEPASISVLARFGEEAFQRLHEKWQRGYHALHGTVEE